MVDVHDDPITLVPADYDAWRERFRAERDRVTAVLEGQDLADTLRRVEHVGSTAVPDLAAKDIVDLNIVVDDDAVAAVSQALLDELGGDRAENSDEWHPVFREANGQRFNVHVFAASSDGWKVSVATREVLLTDDSVREEYEALKRDLAGDTDDLTDYSRGKSAFIGEVLDRARTGDAIALDFEVPEKG
jgi:GrpB-like predicted nucleotidyltransferase (UPF0157 family)